MSTSYLEIILEEFQKQSIPGGDETKRYVFRNIRHYPTFNPILVHQKGSPLGSSICWKDVDAETTGKSLDFLKRNLIYNYY